MSELRNVKVEEIEDVVSYTPNIPDNWYVPARRVWTYLAWCIIQLMDGKRFRNDDDANKCMETIEQWIEDFAITVEGEKNNGTTESNA